MQGTSTFVRSARRAFAAFAGVLLAVTAAAQDVAPLDPDEGRSAIEGRVVHYQGKLPLVVDIVSKAKGQEAPPTGIHVDSAGLFRVRDIQPGSYLLICREKTDGEPEKAEMVRTVWEGVNRVTIVFPDPAEPRLFEGEVQYLDEERPAAFSFLLEPETGDAAPVLVNGEDGRFSVPMPPDGTWVIRSVLVDGEAHPVRRTVKVLPQTTFHRVSINLIRVQKWDVLVVNDAGEPIENARVYRRRGQRAGFHIDPNPWRSPTLETLRGEPVTSDAKGVVRLRSHETAPGWAVVADGYAWAMIRADSRTRAPPERVVLVPGGRVRLHVERWGELEQAEVVFRPLDGPNPWRGGFEAEPDERGDVTVEGLLPGWYYIGVQRRNSTVQGRVYGKTTTVVLAGETREITIRTTPGPKSVRVDAFRVVLHGAADWGKLVSVRVTGAEPDNSEFDVEIELGAPAEDGGVALELEDVAAGRYHALVEPIGWRGVIHVRELDAPLHVPLGKPVTVRLRVVAADTGENVADPTGSWHAEVPDLTSYTYRSIESEAVGATLEFRCVPGSVEVSIGAPGYLHESLSLTTQGGELLERTVELRQAGVVRLRFVEDGRRLDELKGAVVRLEQGTHSRTTSGSVALLDWEVPPGTYRLKARVPGYEVIPARDVHVEARKTREVTIELVPSK